MEREETNIDTLPPVPSIIDTSVEDKRKEKKEEKGIAREENNNNSARTYAREFFFFRSARFFAFGGKWKGCSGLKRSCRSESGKSSNGKDFGRARGS